ncbi:MAG: hypothetical protein EOS70_26530 [Mesorhizobium sp.]|nr:MAG: hypothetical protein EOS70_26530 [Mesorhizobium sp.]
MTVVMLPAQYVMLHGNPALEPIVATDSMIVAVSVLIFAFVVFSTETARSVRDYLRFHARRHRDVLSHQKARASESLVIIVPAMPSRRRSGSPDRCRACGSARAPAPA